MQRGRRLPLAEPIPTLGDFAVLVCRAEEWPHAGFWACGVREPLPVIPVPLDPGVVDVPLDLRPCLDRVDDEGRYDVQLGYEFELSPPFSELDVAWAREVVTSLSARSSS